MTSLLFAALTALQAVGTLLGGFVGSGPASAVSLQVKGALCAASGLLALTSARRGSR